MPSLMFVARTAQDVASKELQTCFDITREVSTSAAPATVPQTSTSSLVNRHPPVFSKPPNLLLPLVATSVSGCRLHMSNNMLDSWFDCCFSPTMMRVTYKSTVGVSAHQLIHTDVEMKAFKRPFSPVCPLFKPFIANGQLLFRT